MAKKVVNKVLDISKFQGVLSNAAVAKIKASGVGVILRLGFTGYGKPETPTMDSCFEANYKALHDAGVPCGAYYFTLCYNDEITNKEIKFLEDKLANKVFEYPIYLDVEPQTNSAGWTNCSSVVRTNNVVRICEALERQKYYVGIYASKSWFGTKLIESYISAYDKWVAQYNPICTYKGKYNMWQYSSKENASKYGITASAYVDISNAYIDFPKVITDAGLNNYAGRKSIVCPKCGEKIYIPNA